MIVSKLLLVLLISLSCLWFAACKSSVTSPLDKEAAEKSQTYWERFFVRCGDSYYGEREFGALTQFRDVSFEVSSIEPTSLDRENGYEWIGEGRLRFTRKRIWNSMAREWADWEGGGYIPTMTMRKQRGKWTIFHRQFEEYIRKPNCKEIPQ